MKALDKPKYVTNIFVCSVMKSGITSATRFIHMDYNDLIVNESGMRGTEEIIDYDMYHYGSRPDIMLFNQLDLNRRMNYTKKGRSRWNVYSEFPIMFMWKEISEFTPNQNSYFGEFTPDIVDKPFSKPTLLKPIKKFIYTHRPVDEWFNSFANWHLTRTMHSNVVKQLWHKWLKIEIPLHHRWCSKWVYHNLITKRESEIKEKYLETNEKIKDHFKRKYELTGENQLFYSSLDDVDSNKLIDFLGFPEWMKGKLKWGHHNKTKNWEHK